MRARSTPNTPESYFKTIKFWKTPLAQCGNGKNDCVPFQQWVRRPGPQITGLTVPRLPVSVGRPPGRRPGGAARLSAALWRRPWLRATLTLSPAAGVVPA